MIRIWNAAPVRFVRDVVDIYFSRHISRSAAELAYFLILTFFPLLICINAFVGLLHLDAARLLGSLDHIIPAAGLSILMDYVNYISQPALQSRALLAAGLTMTLFFASAAFRSLMHTMADLYGRKTYSGLRQIAASVIFSSLFLITIYLSLVVLLTGNWFLHLVESHLPVVGRIIGSWQSIRFVVLFCLMLFFILLVYRVSAPRGDPRPPVLTGGILAAAALVIASMIFSLFIGMSSRYSLVYGSLASVIILLIWLYLCGNILILGNVINYVWYARKQAAQVRRQSER